MQQQHNASWIQVAEGTFVNLDHITCVEETAEGTKLYAGAGPPGPGILVTDKDQRRLVASLISARTAKQLAPAGAGGY